jgi:hypothetical protein
LITAAAGMLRRFPVIYFHMRKVPAARSSIIQMDKTPLRRVAVPLKKDARHTINI